MKDIIVMAPKKSDYILQAKVELATLFFMVDIKLISFYLELKV